ncbi:MAG: hypothetical protein IJ979_06575 [Tidjanibacter sp.]|nr:hypothetical protein [Tidjanibacter sp.]
MKFSFRKLMMALVLPMAVAMVSCNNDDPSYSNPSLTVGSRIMTFTKDGGSNTFDINANRSWTITSSETWLVVSPASNDNKTGVETKTSVSVTATANESGPRSATLTISSPALTEPIVINVSQEGEGATPISEVATMDKGTVVTLKGTVGAVTTQSFVLVDDSGAIVVFIGSEPTVAVGDKATVKGSIGEYAGLKQIDKTDVVVEKTGTDDNWNPTPIDFTADDFTAYAQNVEAKFVKMAGKFTFSDSGKGYNYNNFNMTGSSAKASFSYTPDALVEGFENGSNVIVEGYLVGINSSDFIQIVLVEMTLDESAPEEPETEVSTIETVTNTGEKGNTYKVEGTIAAVTTKSFVVADATGLLYVYTTPKVGGEFLAIGDVVTVEGTYDEYNSICQLKSAIIKESTAAAVALPESVEMDVEALDAYSKNPVVKRATVEATVVVSESGSNTYYNLEFDGTTAFTGSVLYPSEEMIAKLGNGKRVVIDAYLAGFGSKRIQFAAVSVEESTAAYLAAEKSEYEIAAEGGEVEIGINTNVATFTAAVAGIEGAEAVVGEAKVTVTIPENTADEGRTATVTISAEGVDDVTVTIKQEGAASYAYAMVEEAPADYSGTYFITTNNTVKNKFEKGWHIMTNVESNGAATPITVTDGVYNASSTMVAESQVVIAKVEGEDTYTIMLGDKYLYWNGGNALHGSDTKPEKNYKWTIEGAGENGVKIYLVGADSGKDRILYFNSGAGTPYRCYVSKEGEDGTLQSGYHHVSLFKEVTE